MSTGIIGIGTALPLNAVTQKEAAELANIVCCKTKRQARALQKLYDRTGIATRSAVVFETASVPMFFPTEQFDPHGPGTAHRMQLYSQEAPRLSRAASECALKDAGIDAASITHLVTVSCTGFEAPGFDLQLIDSLSLSRNVLRTHIGFMGCHGLLNGLRVAEAFCRDTKNVTLLCATELCSLHFQFGWNSQSIIANSLFADGAGAAVLADLPERKVEYVGSQSFVVPQSETAMRWQIGDHGFKMSLSAEVPSLIEENLQHFISSWLRTFKLNISDIYGWAVHPGGPRILDAVQSSLQLQPDHLRESRAVLSQCGNMSSPTVLFILKLLLAENNKLPCVALGFGPGLTIEAALFR